MMPQLAQVIRSSELNGNPWVCDCVMFNTTYSWCRDNGVDLRVKCSSPLKFKGKLWTFYDKEGCDDNIDIVDEVDEFKVIGDTLPLSPIRRLANYEILQMSTNFSIQSQEQDTAFRINYFYTSIVLFAVWVLLLTVAGMMWLLLKSHTLVRTGPALNNAESSHLQESEV
jgi:hypothetical protein